MDTNEEKDCCFMAYIVGQEHGYSLGRNDGHRLALDAQKSTSKNSLTRRTKKKKGGRKMGKKKGSKKGGKK